MYYILYVLLYMCHCTSGDARTDDRPPWKVMLPIGHIGASAVSAESYIKYYEFQKKDCQEMFIGIGGLLDEADKEWAYLEQNPESSPDAFEHAATSCCRFEK